MTAKSTDMPDEIWVFKTMSGLRVSKDPEKGDTKYTRADLAQSVPDMEVVTVDGLINILIKNDGGSYYDDAAFLSKRFPRGLRILPTPESGDV